MLSETWFFRVFKEPLPLSKTECRYWTSQLRLIFANFSVFPCARKQIHCLESHKPHRARCWLLCGLQVKEEAFLLSIHIKLRMDFYIWTTMVLSSSFLWWAHTQTTPKHQSLYVLGQSFSKKRWSKTAQELIKRLSEKEKKKKKHMQKKNAQCFFTTLSPSRCWPTLSSNP